MKIEVTEKTAFLYSIPNKVRNIMKNRRGAIGIGQIITIVFAVILAASLLPTGIGTWINVTLAGHPGAGWSTSLKAIWNVTPILIVVAVVAGFVAIKRKG